MLATKITPASGDRATLPLDLNRMREICSRSVFQNDDADFTEWLDTAIDDIERMSALKIRQGSFEASFRYMERPTPATYYSTGLDPVTLGKHEELLLPGVNCALGTLTVNGADVAHGTPYGDVAGNLTVPPPADGWQRFSRDDIIVAAFTAGGDVPGCVQQAVGLRTLWHLNQEEEDEMSALRQISAYAYRQDW